MIALLTSFLLLFYPGFQDLPHAFPSEGATRLVDNPRLSAWEVTWAISKPTAMHRHLYDYVGVELVDSQTKVTSPDGQVRTAALKKGTAYFLPKGTTHIEEGITSRHAIFVDLKDAPSPMYENKTSLPKAFPREGSIKVLENQRVIVWDYTWQPGKPTPMHFHDKDTLVVYLAGGELKSTTPDGQSTPRVVAANDAQFNLGNRTHQEELIKGSVRAIIVELK
jgi:hypothetical protein